MKGGISLSSERAQTPRVRVRDMDSGTEEEGIGHGW
jgi:hypothetical protein